MTGAFGYTGKYIARRLLEIGCRVKTITGHPEEGSVLGDCIDAFPFHFDDPERLIETLDGADILFNTYWIRFSYGGMTYENAIENSHTLIRAAEKAGVKRFVHVSITNPSEDSPLPYFRGKAVVERYIRESKLSYAILRPTVLFGKEDILINNIAYLVRRFPVFAVPGSGDYKLQPIYVKDFAKIAIETAQKTDNICIDTVGPEDFTFNELVQVIARKTGSRVRLIHVPPRLALSAAKALGTLLGDVLLTQDEMRGLMSNLLISDEPPRGEVYLTQWLEEHQNLIGRGYASELERHYFN